MVGSSIIGHLSIQSLEFFGLNWAISLRTNRFFRIVSRAIERYTLSNVDTLEYIGSVSYPETLTSKEAPKLRSFSRSAALFRQEVLAASRAAVRSPSVAAVRLP